MSDMEGWTIEKCKDWLEDPYNKPDPETDDTFDRAFYKEVKQRYRELLKDKIYIKPGHQLGLPNEKFYEVPWDADDEMLLDIQNWWEGK